MKKSDLKNGMVVECRNGDLLMVVDDIIIGYNGWNQLSYYNDDLKENFGNSNLDIVKIYDKIKTLDKLNKKEKLELIWERKEVEKETLTQDQHNKLKALLTLDYNWIARDKDSYLYVYNKKPIKMITCWERIDKDETCVLSLSVLGFNIPFIKWEEDEPRSIEDLLKLEVK